MSISDMNKKTIIKYIIATIFCIIFAIIYETFSHQVYSKFMIFAFLLPLCLGAIPFYFISKQYQKKLLPKITLELYHAGVCTLTVGSIFKGVLEIYGTTNDLVNIYLYVGITLIIICILIYILPKN